MDNQTAILLPLPFTLYITRLRLSFQFHGRLSTFISKLALPILEGRRVFPTSPLAPSLSWNGSLGFLSSFSSVSGGLKLPATDLCDDLTFPRTYARHFSWRSE